MWLDVIRALVEFLSSGVGLGLGLAIIATTLLLRTALLPITWPVAYRSCVRQKKMMRLRPELQRLKEEHADNAATYGQKMLELYRAHDIKLFDGTSLLSAFAQMPLLLGMVQALKTVGESVRFLWIRDLLKPDITLAIIAGVTTAVMMMVNPDMPEQTRALMILVPSVIALIVTLKFSSALALYWATSNCCSALQTFVLHRIVARRVRAGTVKI
jgi:YidC/Oxa1 family membrane protein insertase